MAPRLLPTGYSSPGGLSRLILESVSLMENLYWVHPRPSGEFFFALVFSIIAAVILGFSWKIGLIIGASAMLGDLLSSFSKRRLGLKPSSQATGLDQIPESLFPLLAVVPVFGLEWQQILILVFVFIVFNLVFSRILYKLKIRKKPY